MRPKPNLAEFGKNGRISAWPKPKPKFGATLLRLLLQWFQTTHFVPKVKKISACNVTTADIVLCCIHKTVCMMGYCLSHPLPVGQLTPKLLLPCACLQNVLCTCKYVHFTATYDYEYSKCND